MFATTLTASMSTQLGGDDDLSAAQVIEFATLMARAVIDITSNGAIMTSSIKQLFSDLASLDAEERLITFDNYHPTATPGVFNQTSLENITDAMVAVRAIEASVANQTGDGASFKALVTDLREALEDVAGNTLDGAGGYGLIRSENETPSDVALSDVVIFEAMLAAQSSAQNQAVYDALSSGSSEYWPGSHSIDGLTSMVSAVRIDMHGTGMLIGDTDLAVFMGLTPENREIVYLNAEAMGSTFNTATAAVDAIQTLNGVLSGETITTISGTA